MQILRPYLKNILLIGHTAWLIARAVDAMDNEIDDGISLENISKSLNVVGESIRDNHNMFFVVFLSCSI